LNAKIVKAIFILKHCMKNLMQEFVNAIILSIAEAEGPILKHCMKNLMRKDKLMQAPSGEHEGKVGGGQQEMATCTIVKSISTPAHTSKQLLYFRISFNDHCPPPTNVVKSLQTFKDHLCLHLDE